MSPGPNILTVTQTLLLLGYKNATDNATGDQKFTVSGMGISLNQSSGAI